MSIGLRQRANASSSLTIGSLPALIKRARLISRLQTLSCPQPLTFPEDPAMTPTEIANWIAVYAATGICCAFAIIYRERIWRMVTNGRSTALLIPQIWWRWQKRYLFSTPVTLAIVSAFAFTLDWSH